jgi:type II secretory pathway component PulK
MRPQAPSPTAAKGSILVAVLWCLALLSVVVVSVLHTARQDLRLARHQGDLVQARYFAIAGIERAKAALFEDLRQRRRASRPANDALGDSPDIFRDVALGRGRFSVIQPGSPADAPRHGVADESGRLDINVVQTNELLRLPGMTHDVAVAILDWRDPDSVAGPGGAEADYYGSLNPPRLPRNGPFQTLRELMMVRGITRERMSGMAGQPGWNVLLGLGANSPSLNAAGEPRVDLRTADERSLANVRGFNQDIARAIVARRGREEFRSLLDLLELTPAPPSGGPGNPGGRSPSPGLPDGFNPGGGGGGPRLVSQDLLIDVADLLTTGDNDNAQGRININSAQAEVLACLDGIDLTAAQSLVAYRQSVGGFSHPVALLRAPGMTVDRLRPILGRLTADSDTWRILAEGTVPDRDTRVRVEEVVRLDLTRCTTLSHREDDL